MGDAKECSPESVGDFAHSHRFCETQHELEKLIPKIHGELELIYAFVIKLREDISRDLISREFNYTTLQSLITAAQRYESHIGQNIGLEKLRSSRTDELFQWQPRPTQAHATMHIGTVEKPILGHSNSRSTRPSGGKVTGNSQFRGSSTALHKKGDPSSQYCFSFDRNSISSCEMPDNKCRNRRQHRCMTCQHWGCKQVNHPPAGQVVNNPHVPSKYLSGTTHRPIPQAHVLSSPPPSAVNGNVSTTTGEIKQMRHDMKSEIRSDMQSLTTHMEKLETSPSTKLPPSGPSSRDILNELQMLFLASQLLLLSPIILKFRTWIWLTKTFFGHVSLQLGFPSLSQ